MPTRVRSKNAQGQIELLFFNTFAWRASLSLPVRRTREIGKGSGRHLAHQVVTCGCYKPSRVSPTFNATQPRVERLDSLTTSCLNR
jgi:hypothetical protein